MTEEEKKTFVQKLLDEINAIKDEELRDSEMPVEERHEVLGTLPEFGKKAFTVFRNYSDKMDVIREKHDNLANDVSEEEHEAIEQEGGNVSRKLKLLDAIFWGEVHQTVGWHSGMSIGVHQGWRISRSQPEPDPMEALLSRLGGAGAMVIGR